MIWIWITIIILSIGLIVCAFIISNLLNQVKQLEAYSIGYVDSLRKQGNDFDKYYEYLIKLFTETYAQLQRIDKRGSFSSDDEVGFSFNVILQAIALTKEKLSALKIKDPVEDTKPEEK